MSVDLTREQAEILDQFKNGQASDSKWDNAISDAKAEIAETERRIGRLRNALRIFKEQKLKGIPWPGNAETGGTDDAV